MTAGLPLARAPGWEARLVDLFDRHHRTPFAWDAHNCASFAIEAVAALTGARLIVEARTLGLAAPAVFRHLQELGGLALATSAVLGPAQLGWRSARRGDIALVELNGREALVVCSGQTLCGPGPDGLAHVPLTEALMVWRIG